MRRFLRRNGEGGTGRASAPARTSASQAHDREEPDWRAYDSIAEGYARVHQPRMEVPAADLVELANLASGARVLDVGTGTGAVARAASAAVGAEGMVVGIDASMPMLTQARSQGGGPKYAAAEAIDLPFRDQAFGAVLAGFVLAHFTRYETALFDILRVLATGGTFGVSTWGPSEDEFQRAWREVCEHYAEHEVLRDAMATVVPWEERFADPERLKMALHDAGVRDILISRRQYRFQMTADDYLLGRESAASGRFLRQMLGPELWERLRARAREVFAERFDDRFYDFRDVIVAVGFKP
jgi:ubiquinone/menaquinone biosynthesis C-methylase UbiE